MLSFPDLTENELKIRSNFFKSVKRGTRISGLVGKNQDDQNDDQQMGSAVDGE